MKKCFVCKKKIENTEGKICTTCFNFFKDKYGNKFRQHLEKIEDYLKKESDLIKFRRKK